MHVNNAAPGGKKREYKPERNVGRFLQTFVSNRSEGSADITRRAASASEGCGSIGEDRLKRRTVAGERKVGRGHCSARSPNQDVTSVLKHVAGLWPPCKVSDRVSTCRRWAGLCQVMDVID